MKIVIPKSGTYFHKLITRGSGVVMISHEHHKDIPCIYYEGNLYDAVNLRTYEDRIKCAAGRAHTHYPTIACSAILPENTREFITVGICLPEQGYRISFAFGSEPIIKEWLS